MEREDSLGGEVIINMDKDDFCHCNFPNGWECSVDRLDDGVKVVFPIRM